MLSRRHALLWLFVVLGGASLSHAADGTIAYLAVSGDYWQVWTMDPDGSNSRQVTKSPYEKSRISWFPDGRRVLVNSLSGDLNVIDVNTGREERVECKVSGMTDAVLSPDGTRIAFSLSIAGSVDDNEIFVMGVDGSGIKKLTNMKHLQHNPSWGPAGRWIYFLSGEDVYHHDIWRVELESGARQQLTVGAVYHFDVAAASDGRIAFSNNQTGNYELYVRDAEERVRRLTQSPALDGHPSWSPDEKELVFHSVRSGLMNIWKLGLNREEAVQLTNHPIGARNPAWWAPLEGSI